MRLFPKKIATFFRSAIAVSARRLPWPVRNERWFCPRKSYPATQDWLKQTAGRIPGVHFIPLDPPATVTRPDATTLPHERHWAFEHSRSDSNWGTFICKIAGGRVFRHDGIVITPDGALLGDINREPGRPPGQHSALKTIRIPPPRRFAGNLAVLVMRGNVYFHWMMDLLPRIDLLRRAGINLKEIDGFLVDRLDMPYQKETLARLGIPLEKAMIASYDTHWKADCLLVPSLAGTSGNMLAHNYRFLRSLYPSPPSPQRGRRIYLSRADSSYRRVTNEPAVESVLAQFGFESVAMNGRTVSEQAEIFSSCEAIVAPHGSGLTNAVFCEPGTRILEIFSPRYVNCCYYALSHRGGLEYSYLIGEGNRPPEGQDPHDITADITVDTVKLRRLVEAIPFPSRMPARQSRAILLK